MENVKLRRHQYPNRKFMNTHADKVQENKSQSVSNGLTQKEGSSESAFQFADNRPELIAQRKIQEMANTSSQVSQLRAFQAMADNSPQVKQALQFDNHSGQQTIQKNGTGQEENASNSSKAKNAEQLKPSEIMKQKIDAANKSDNEDDETSSPSLADRARQIMVEEEEEEWDEVNISDSAEVLPGVKEFTRQTDAGIFARRDDLLIEIDNRLEQCNLYRERLNLKIVDINELEKDAKADGALKIRTAQDAKALRIFYNQKLGYLEQSVEKWLKQFQSDTSSSLMHRRTSIKSLLPAIKSEQEMSLDERVQSVKEKEVKEMERAKKESEKKQKADKEVRSRPPFTPEEFKAEAKIVMTLPYSNLSNVVSGLKAFHAIPKPRRDNNIQFTNSIRLRLEACEVVISAAKAADEKIKRLKEHPGYEKGHMGYEKKSHDILQDALSKLLSQCSNYYNENRTAK